MAKARSKSRGKKKADARGKKAQPDTTVEAAPAEKAEARGEGVVRPTAKARNKQVRTIAMARRRFSDSERQRIIRAAKREGLTGGQVSKRFGISTVTYYLWRKKDRRSQPANSKTKATTSNGDISAEIRTLVRESLRRLIPEIVREELVAALGQERKLR